MQPLGTGTEELQQQKLESHKTVELQQWKLEWHKPLKPPLGGVAVAIAGVATMDTDEANTCEPGAICGGGMACADCSGGKVDTGATSPLVLTAAELTGTG